MGIAALLAQRQPLRNTKAMLFIDDSQAQAREIDTFLNQRMCSDHQVRSGRRLQLHRLFCGLLQAARQPRNLDPERRQPRPQFEIVLLGKDFCRRHESSLITRFDGLAGGQCGNDGLAAANIALQQTLHRIGLRKVAGNLGNDALLRASQAKRQYRQQLLPELAGRLERWRALLPPCVIGATQ